MVDESVEVLEMAEPVEQPVAAKALKYDVETFDWHEHCKYFPIEHYDKLMQMFQDRSYGWKHYARLFHKLKESEGFVEELKSTITNMCEGTSRTRDPMKDTRSGLRRVITGLTEEKLQELCLSKNVSYNSFMSGNDRQGLVEAIIDELLVDV